MEIKKFFRGFADVSLWWRMAWSDMNVIYRRSFLGIFWISLSFMLFIGVKIFIFGTFMTEDITLYALWVTIGYAVWTFMNHAIMDGCMVFVKARSWILATRLSLGTFVAQNITRHLIDLFMVSLISFFAIIYLQYEQSLVTLTVIPAIIVLIINSMWVHIVLGFLSARFRDLMHLVRAIMHVMFFVTPIIFMPENLGPKAVIMNYNPFTHYIAIVREPIVHGRISELAWIVVGCFTVAGWLAALWMIRRGARTLAFWI